MERRDIAKELALTALPVGVSSVVTNLTSMIDMWTIIGCISRFGCGSSREHAPIAIRASGISCVIAATFARIFYRNAINIGLPILECEEAAADISDRDEVDIDFDSGIITNVTKHRTYKAEPFPDFIKDIISAGGLLNSLKNKKEG